MIRSLPRRIEIMTATMSTTPVRTVCTLLEMPMMTRPFASDMMTRLPTTVPRIEPVPPVRGVPPMTTAEMASSSKPVPTVGLPGAELRGQDAAAEPGQSARKDEHRELHARRTGTPRIRVLSSSPPIAKV